MNMLPKDLRRKIIEEGFKSNSPEIIKAIEAKWKEVDFENMPRKDTLKKRRKVV